MTKFLLVAFFSFYLRILGWTSKFKFIYKGDMPPHPYIYMFWHRRLMMLAYSHRAKAIRILASTSRDGDVSAGVNKSLGYKIIRGTASTPSEAMRSTIKILRALKNKRSVAITPDGPRGPACKVKMGVPYMARKSGCQIIPVTCSAKRKIVLNSWDRFILPLPFNRAVVLTGKPVYIKKDEPLGEWPGRLEKILNGLGAEADSIAGNL